MSAPFRSPRGSPRGPCGGPLRVGISNPRLSSNEGALPRIVSPLSSVCSPPVSPRSVVRPVNSYKGFMLKSTATAQTPALTVLEALAATLGAVRRSRFAMVTGALGAAVGTYYITKVTASHDGHERAFGPDWRQRISAGAERRMLPRRRSMRLPRVPVPGWTRERALLDHSRHRSPAPRRHLGAGRGRRAHRNGHVYLYGGSWHFFDKDVLARAPSSPAHRREGTSSWMPPTGAARDGCVRHGGRRASRGGLDRGERRALGIDPDRVVVMGGSSGAASRCLPPTRRTSPAWSRRNCTAPIRR